MTTKSELLKILMDSPEEYVSGQEIAGKLDISRNAIWKAVASLRNEGYSIESRNNRGYKLTNVGNILTEDAVRASLNVDCDLEVYTVVTSTNDLMKEREIGETPRVIVANKQSAGRGRLGRSFESPGGTGLYFTIGFKPRFDMDRAPIVTMAAAVAICRAIEHVVKIHPVIKWVNDIFYDGKKCCGILTEAQTDLENGSFESIICGIGVNCFPGSFPPELEGIAGSLSDEVGSFSRSTLAAEMINEFVALLDQVQDRGFLDEYRERCFVTGETIKVHSNYDDKGVLANALEIADDGGLVVEYLEGPKAGSRETIHTGEISISMA